jgi:nucleolysin TIA-1/TIAR
MNVFIGGLIYEETPETLLAELRPAYPTITSARIIRDESGRSKGFGFLSFTSEQEARRCMQERNGTTLRGRVLRLNDSHHSGGGAPPPPPPGPPPFFMPPPPFGFPGFPPPPFPFPPPPAAGFPPPPAAGFLPPPAGFPPALAGGPPPLPPHGFPPPPPYAPQPLESEGVTTVFVGNVASFASEGELFALFSPCGPVSGINMQRAKSCAFVQFRYRACAEAALARLAGAPLAGIPMRLSWGRHVAKGVAPPAAAPQPAGAPPAATAAAAAWGAAAPPPAPSTAAAAPAAAVQKPAPLAGAAPEAEARRVFADAADSGDASRPQVFNAAAANALWGFMPWSGEALSPASA